MPKIFGPQCWDFWMIRLIDGSEIPRPTTIWDGAKTRRKVMIGISYLSLNWCFGRISEPSTWWNVIQHLQRGAKWFRYRVSIHHPLGFNWHPFEGPGWNTFFFFTWFPSSSTKKCMESMGPAVEGSMAAARWPEKKFIPKKGGGADGRFGLRRREFELKMLLGGTKISPEFFSLTSWIFVKVNMKVQQKSMEIWIWD